MSDHIYLYGVAPVQQCLIHSSRPCRTLFIKDNFSSPRLKEIDHLARQKKIPVVRTNPHKLGTMAGSKLHQGVVLQCGELKMFTPDEFLEFDHLAPKKLLVALDLIEDPQNVGAIIRTAAFLGANGLITLSKKAAPLTPTVSKTSAGALEYFPIIQVGNLSECLNYFKTEAFSIVGAGSDASMNFREVPITDYMILIMGNEGQGLRQLTQKRCDHLIHIPGDSSTESLNVNAASAILIQHLSQSIFA